jgi:NADH:ubiquinone oxidoreductase subunit 3 (subunit A)
MSPNRVLLRKYACGIRRFHLVGQPVYNGFVTVALLFELADAFVELG